MSSNKLIIDKLTELFSELILILEKNRSEDINYQVSEVRYINNLLNQCRNNNYIDSESIINEIKSIHKKIYPARGGLSDFFIWKTDYNERLKANEPLERIGDELWKMLY